MRKSFLSICLLSVVTALLSACGPEVYVEGSPHHEINRPYDPIVEVCAAAKDAVKSLMTDEIVLSFLKKYEEERKANPELSELPVVKLTKPKNETNDPDLNMTQLTDALCEALRETGCFEVSSYEGEGRRGFSRTDFLVDDPYYEQQKEPIQAARLVLYSEVVSNMTRDGQITVVSRTIKVSLVEVNSGVKLSEHIQQVSKKKNSYKLVRPVKRPPFFLFPADIFHFHRIVLFHPDSSGGQRDPYRLSLLPAM